MSIKSTVKSPVKADLICPVTGRRHLWGYIRRDLTASPVQEAIYKCTECDMAILKSDLKQMTDGGE